MRPTGEAEGVGGAVIVGGREGVGLAILAGTGGNSGERGNGHGTEQGEGASNVFFKESP